ncbi:phosphatase PAP2 family protein [Sphingobium phenoxybenzoativorans]|uniref:phosphatase PAP2 family protein n=1 Tax=Sphingobium phenoxybenzoativorans TaxID=1592790 RepID=UPI0008732B3A|nr:phosphatase PAP2 family protein [Sphingobium phenoxybenzoativorans]
MRTIFHRRARYGLAAAALACAPLPAQASDKGWDDAGTITRDALMIAAVGVPVVKGDWQGLLQAGGSIGATKLLNYGMKEAFPEWRPDRSDRKSFPSGHTSTAFAAAATLQNRYGWEVGLPAHLAAAFVGFSRVQADRHHWYDVVAGAALGEVTGLLITSKQNDRVQVVPWAGRDGGGVALAMRF